jgi:hypothetical protein
MVKSPKPLRWLSQRRGQSSRAVDATLGDAMYRIFGTGLAISLKAFELAWFLTIEYLGDRVNGVF